MCVSSVCMSSALTHAARSSHVGVLLDTDANFDGSSLSVNSSETLSSFFFKERVKWSPVKFL